MEEGEEEEEEGVDFSLVDFVPIVEERMRSGRISKCCNVSIDQIQLNQSLNRNYQFNSFKCKSFN